MIRRLLFLLLLVPAAHSQTVSWGGNPSAVSTVPYTVVASAPANLTVYKNGQYFGSGAYYVSGTTSDTGVQTVNFTANGVGISDGLYYYGTRSISITAGVPPSSPSVSASPSTMYPNTAFTGYISVYDSDGDLDSYGLRYQGYGLIGWWPGSGASGSGSVNANAPSTVGSVVRIRGEVWDKNGHGVTGDWVEYPVQKASQTISFGSLANKTYGDSAFSVSATASSGLPVSFSVLSGPASISGSTVTISGVGTVTIRASQPGDANYNAAAPVDRSFSVAKASQTISFGSLASKTYGDPAFTVSATASSGLPVSFSVLSGPASINGSTVTISGVGTVTIRASQSGNANYNAATSVDRSFAVVKANQTISFGTLSDKTYGDPPFAVSASASSGLVVQFSVVSGPATLNGTTVTLTGPGTVTIRAAQPGNANYSAATSVDRSFQVVSSVAITVQPQSQTVSAGENITFSVTASGSGSLSYQWQKNGANISGATGPSYLLTNVQTSSAGNYRVIVTGSSGSVTSSDATLTVNPAAPTITTQPQSETVAAGANVSFAVAAKGTNPLGYQWRKNGSDIAGATSATYVITGVQMSHAGTYTVNVSNSVGSTLSNAATLTITAAPVITQQPQNQTVATGGTVTFTVTATGNPAPTYQWRKDGANIAGAASAALSISNAQPSHAGSYTVVVTNALGSVTSAAAVLTVSSGAPAITSQPQPVTVTVGDTTTMSVTATGNPTLTYQWRKNGANLSNNGHVSGATSATLNFSNVDASDTASYDVVVTNGLGSATSAVAVLIVQDPNVSGDGGSLPANWPNQEGTGPSRPGGGTYAVGMTKGNLSVDKSGALTYSIPLWVVPGTSGMQPQLALNYSSQAGSGIAGFGWSLGGASAITRGPKTLAVDGSVHGVDFTPADRFYLDGQRLIAVGAGTYGSSGTEYRTEIDAISKIVSYGSAGTGPAYFKVWTKAGLVIELGNTTTSAAEATGRSEISTWAVNRITDAAGNYMTFSYFEDTTAGEQRLTQIDYTGNASSVPVLSTYASVQFTYETRSDSSNGYVAGSKVSRTKRLKTIEAYYGSELVRKYTLDYVNRNLAPSDGAGRSILTTVHEADGSGKEYPPLTFDYETATAGFTSAASSWNPPGLLGKYNDNPRGSGFVDLNGDGRPDFIQHHVDSGGSVVSSEYGAWLNTVTGWTPAGAAFYPPVPLAKDGVADIGTRIVDVNGDGIADLFGGDGEIYINSGSGFAADSGWFVPIPDTYPLDSWASYSKPMFMDLNGDGRVDLVSTVTYHWANLNLVIGDSGKTGAPTEGTAAADGGVTTDSASQQSETVQAAWLNTGSGWELWPSYYPMLNMSQGSRFVDVNGDGLPDQVQHWRDQATVIKNVALNTGAGWSVKGATSVYVPPEMLNQNSGGTDGASVGTEMVDLNGDGLVDLVHRNDASGNAYGSSAWLNTGAGWVSAPTGLLSSYELTHDATPQGIALVDVNSDGLPDLVQAWGTSGRDVRLGTGLAWSASASSFAVARQIAQTDRPSVGTDFIDIDADGAVDQIWAWSENGTTTSGAAFNGAKPADRLKTVTNGFGVSANIFYAPLTERDSSGNYTVYQKGTGGPAGSVNVIGPMYVVKTVKNDDGVGGTYDVNYRYGGLRSDFLRGSLGFEWMQSADARTGIVSKTTSSQVYPFIGMPVASQTKTSGGTILSSSSVTYAEVAGMNAGTHLPYASQTTESSSDLNGSPIATTTTNVTDIDTYGNVKGMSVSTNGGFSKTTTSTYALADTTNWVLGRLTRSTVTAAAPGKPTLTRTSSFDYHPTTHLLTQEVVEPDDAAMLKLTTDYQYDDWGNKKIATVTGKDVNAAGQTITTSRTTTTIYDAKGRFPDHSLNALNHQETYFYDQKLGVMTSLQGPNLLTTTWEYDTFGNKIHEGRADLTVTDIALKWAGSGAPAGAKYLIETTATGAAPSLVFFDAFGRKIKAVGLDGNGQMIHQDTAYDNMSRAYAVSMPYRPGSTVYWTQTTLYDVLSRPLTVQTPDDQNGTVTTTFAYAGLTTSVTDGKLRVARTVKNSQGWVTSSTRDLNGIAAAVTYEYDAFGNLTQTTASGSSTVMEYDLRGRKTTMKDPDMGGSAHPWSYGYNAFGELVTQTDAKNQTVRMTYDALGRLIQRIEQPEGTTTWTYDTATKGVGKLAAVSAPGSYGESYSYDNYSRPSAVTRTISGSAYTISQFYDSASRPLRTVYPTGFQVKNVYNAFGFAKEVRRTNGNNDNLDLYWKADTYAVDGRVNGDTLGNGVTGDRIYSPATGRLLGAGVGLGTSNTVQLISYLYDQVGNVTRRNDGPTGRSEGFEYDTLDRLTSHALSGGATVTVNYNANGNISDKSDVATSYTYGSNAGPHALTGISGGPKGTQTYTYDDNGNMTGGGGRSIQWTSFNQARVISDDTGHSTTFTFGAAHERIKQVAVNGSITNTTIYVGGIFELVTSSGGTEEKNYIITPAGRVAVYTAGTYALANVRFFHTDGLGSITAVTDDSGNVVKRFAYDAWGKRTDPATGAVTTSATNGHFTRGFTDHEALDDLGLIHMNGRVYDPVLGRFLSADPNIDGAYDSQGYNKYSYVGNNPMNRTDPSGFFSLKDGLKIVAVVVAAYVTAGLAVYAVGTLGGTMVGGAALTVSQSFAALVGAHGLGLTLGGAIAAGAGAGFASGFAGSLLNGGSIGDAFKAGVIGGVIGGVAGGLTYGIGSAFPGNDQIFDRMLAHGVIEGGVSEAQGGQFRHGFYAGFSTAGAAPFVGKGMAGVVESAVIGGTASALGGGKFANGAVSGAFQYLLNHRQHDDDDGLVAAHKAALAKLKAYVFKDDEYAIFIHKVDVAEGVAAYTFSDVYRGESGTISGKLIAKMLEDPTVVGMAHTHNDWNNSGLSPNDLVNAIFNQWSVSSIDKGGLGEIYRYPGARGVGANEARSYAASWSKAILAWRSNHPNGSITYDTRFNLRPSENMRVFFAPGALTPIEIK